MKWTKELPTEPGWYWYGSNEFHWPVNIRIRYAGIIGICPNRTVTEMSVNAVWQRCKRNHLFFWSKAIEPPESDNED